MAGKSGIVLMYNCSDAKYFKLKQIFAMLKLRMRVVGPDKYHLTLAELVEGKGEPAEQHGEAFAETALVFCGMGGPFLNQVLEIIRVGKMPPIDFKAVLTEENQNWDSHKLMDELRQEKAALAEQKES